MSDLNVAVPGREMTFGEKAVGLTFNPGGNEKVNTIKVKFAEAIDLLNAERDYIKASPTVDSENGERLRMLSIAITELQTAQMWAVKAVTWMQG